MYTLTFEDNMTGSRQWVPNLWYESANNDINFKFQSDFAGDYLYIWADDTDGQFIARNVNTDGIFSQQYGYFEIFAKLPYGVGPYPAFWLTCRENNIHSNGRPEITVMQAYPGASSESGWSTADHHSTAYQCAVWEAGSQLDGYKQNTNLADLSATWHTYGCKWERGRTTFYFDGVEMYSVNSTIDQPMFIVLSLLYGSSSGTPSVYTTPLGINNSFVIDYVRVWQFNGASALRFKGTLKAGTATSSGLTFTGYNGFPNSRLPGGAYYGTLGPATAISVGQTQRYVREIEATSDTSSGYYTVTLKITQGDDAAGDPGLTVDSITSMKIIGLTGSEIYYTDPKVNPDCQFNQRIMTNQNSSNVEGYTSWTWTISQNSIARFQHGQEYQIEIY